MWSLILYVLKKAFPEEPNIMLTATKKQDHPFSDGK